MTTLPATTTEPAAGSGAPVATVPPPLPRCLTTRQENYCRGVAAGLSYVDALRGAGYLSATTASPIWQLNKNPLIRARVAELRKIVDAELASTMVERMNWLRLIISADAEELSRVISEPCGTCWTEPEIAHAFGRYFSPSPFVDERPAMPDLSRPRANCTGCRGEGLKRVVLTPTDELSPAARALFKGAKQNEKGVIEIQTHDQLNAADMLNRMQSAYVTRSVNINANMAVPTARDANPEDALRLFAAFGS